MGLIGPYGFKGGWNTKESAWTLPKDSLTDSQNINIVHQDIMKRAGNAKLNSTALNSAAVITGAFDWLINSGTRYLLVVAGNKLYNSSTLSSTFSDITGAVTITAGQNNQHTFASLNNIAVCCGGATPDAPIKWTGTGNAAVLGGTPPSGNLVCVANNFMFIAGVAANPSKVYWSNASDPETWNVASVISFRESDGDSVTAIIELNQNLLIFKRRSIGLLYTQTNTVSGAVTLAPLTEVIVGIGCPGGQCVENLPDGSVIFLGSNAHVYLIQGGTSVIDISDPKDGSNIQPTLDSMNISRLQYAVVKTYPTRNQVWFSMSSSGATTNDTILVYDYQIGVWVSKFININANVMEPTIDTRSTPSHPIVMVTGDYGGFVYEQDTGTSDATYSGAAIDGYGTISIQNGVDATDFTPRCAVVPIEAQSTGGSLSVGYGFNGLNTVNSTTTISQTQPGFQLDVSQLDSGTLAGPVTLKRIIPLPNNGRAYTTQLQFRTTGSAQPFTVHPIYISDQLVV